MYHCCENRKHTLGCWKGLGDNSTTPPLLGNGSLIFTQKNITIHGYNFTYKRNVSPFAYVYVTMNGEEALIYYNIFQPRIRGSFELNDGRSFAFNKCLFKCEYTRVQKINEILSIRTIQCSHNEYVFYQLDQNYLRDAFFFKDQFKICFKLFCVILDTLI